MPLWFVGIYGRPVFAKAICWPPHACGVIEAATKEIAEQIGRDSPHYQAPYTRVIAREYKLGTFCGPQAIEDPTQEVT